jgi:hypothetical protein
MAIYNDVTDFTITFLNKQEYEIQAGFCNNIFSFKQ